MGSRANILVEDFISVGGGTDHQVTAGEFAIAESQEQAGATVDYRLAVGAEGKRAEAEAGEANENRRLISDFAPSTETAHAQGSHVGGKADAEKVDVVQDSIFVAQAQDIAFARASGNQ